MILPNCPNLSARPVLGTPFPVLGGHGDLVSRLRRGITGVIITH